MEEIKLAAIKLADGTVRTLPRPNRHPHIIWKLNEEKGGKEWQKDHEQGFITNEGKFVDRKTARKIAENAGQLLDRAIQSSRLFSEDVW